MKFIFQDISRCQFLVNLFHPCHIRDAVMVVFKKRAGPNRKFISLGIILFCLHIMPMFGEKGLIYIYTKERYNWGVAEYSTYSSITQAVSLTGNYCRCIAFFIRVIYIYRDI